MMSDHKQTYGDLSSIRTAIYQQISDLEKEPMVLSKKRQAIKDIEKEFNAALAQYLSFEKEIKQQQEFVSKLPTLDLDLDKVEECTKELGKMSHLVRERWASFEVCESLRQGLATQKNEFFRLQEEIEKDTLSRRAQLRAELKDVEALITQTLASSLKTSMPASAAEAAQQPLGDVQQVAGGDVQQAVEAAQQPLGDVQQVADADLPGVLAQATGDSVTAGSRRGGASFV